MSKIEPKSPLTIIAIFAGIIEASALASLPFLGEDSQGIYTWFLVGFPFFLTVLFFLTLNFNYKSLYSPEISDSSAVDLPAPAPIALQIESPPSDVADTCSPNTPVERVNALHVLPDISELSTVTIEFRGPAASQLIEYFALQAIKPTRLPCNKWILSNLDTGAQITLTRQSMNKA
ncbi:MULTISPECIES: hypothetical protein [Pseudomonas]|nr:MULTISPECIES: hypothetical protein [Pseudomonas]